MAGALGDKVIAMQPGELELQVLLAVTQTFPAVVPKVTVTVFVPCPAVTLAPVGTVQL